MGMRGSSLAGLIIAVSLAAVTGCGQPSRGAALESTTAATPSAAGSASPSAPPATGSASPSPSASETAPADCAGGQLAITNADNGKTVCVRPGTVLHIDVKNATGPVQHTGPLEPGADKNLVASKPGTATISTVISPCASATGTVHCMVLELFRMRVEIVARP